MGFHSWILILLTAVSLTARAEYRAFLLKISGPKSATPAPPEQKEQTPAGEPSFRLVKSNLDPNQYGTYYPLAPGESISYTETWMCRGRTSNFKEVCDNPKRTPAQNP